MRSQTLFLLLGCACLNLTTWLLLAKKDRHNPVSHFFDPDETTYAAPYSSRRAREGRLYVTGASGGMKTKVDIEKLLAMQEGGGGMEEEVTEEEFKSVTSLVEPDLVVVILTIARDEQQYLDASLGSLLESVSDEQRRRLYLNVVFGDEDPEMHPFYHYSWLRHAVDEMTVRRLPSPMSEPSDEYLPPLRVMAKPAVDLDKYPPKTSLWHVKATLDYAMALQACKSGGERTKRATHCLILEDDTVLAESWYADLRAYLDEAMASFSSPSSSPAYNAPRSRIAALRASDTRDWGHMRLFYAEKYFGWEDTEVRGIIYCIGLATLVSGLVLSFLLQQRLLTTAILCAFIGLELLLVVLAGRNHIHRIPAGLSEMKERGCCTQAILYPIAQIDAMVSYLYAHVREKPYDINLNAFLDGANLRKLATNPPLVQHIGARSSRGLGYSRASPLWSFAFERLGAAGQRPL